MASSSNYFAYGNYHVDNGQSMDALNTHRYTRNDIRTAENELLPTDPYTNSKVQTNTNIFIYSNGAIVGMIQNFNISEQRRIDKLWAIGWEGVVQSVPSNTNGGTLNISRIALYDSSIFSALGLTTHALPHNKLGSKIHNINAHTEKDKWDLHNFETELNGKTISSGLVFRTLRDQRTPLEIQVRTRMKGDISSDAFYVTTYIDAWLSQFSKSYSVGQIYVTEQATIRYADVY